MALICTIRSRVLEKEDEAGLREGGYYELPIRVSMAQAAGTGDAKGFIQTYVASCMAQAVKDTGIPLGVGMWSLEFSKFAQINLNYPSATIFF